MRRFSLIISALCFSSFSILAQSNLLTVPPPVPGDFAGILSFLSSDQMEGREAGTHGNFMAADYIASMMQFCGLEPYGDPDTINTGMLTDNVNQATVSGKFFQDFEMKLYWAEKVGSYMLILGKPGSVLISNVIGIIRGKDSTKSVIVGAHFDHLGIRNGQIYNGSDDNASGVAGMLSLAKNWRDCGEKPPCNIIFAAWNGEEKGCLGSHYYVKHTGANPDIILTYINMDMISRSAPEDTTGRQLSIGTRPADEALRQTAMTFNLRLSHPFELDLWDVTGHSGSDYSSFIANNIPVMTFFSGYQADYHTPADDAAKADLQKMQDILKIVNDCLGEILSRFPVK
jgi:Zn-dependent M28 family amino/carboxypeptidase